MEFEAAETTMLRFSLVEKETGLENEFIREMAQIEQLGDKKK